jgi:hypothetical protein
MVSKKLTKKHETKKQHAVIKAIKAAYRHFWDHFIPHEGNDHVPHVLKHRVLFGYSVIILLLKVLVVATPILLPSASLYSNAITASNVILLTNQTRSNLGLGGLVQNTKLMAAAQAKAMDMLKNQYFAHNSPNGLTPWYFIKSLGYAYERAGENLAVHYTSAEGLHDGWLASPAHRANIVKEEFTEIGVGVVNGDFEGYPSTIVVQFFGRPKAEVMPELIIEEPKIENGATELVSENNVVAVSQDEKIKESPIDDEKAEPIVADLSNDADKNEPGTIISNQEPIIQTKPEVKQAVVDASSLVVKPTRVDGIFEVNVKAGQAEAVAVQMGPEWVDLELDAKENVWKGEIAGTATYNKNGETMQIITKDEDGAVSAQTAALIAPEVSTQDFFVFSDGESKSVKFFGFLRLDYLDDKVNKFYIYIMLFLATALILKVLIKIHVQKVSNIAHACFVIGFAMVMFLM